MRVQLSRIAVRVGASVGVAADIRKEQFVVSGTLGAIDAIPGGGNKLRVPLVERRLFQEQENILLNPLLQVPNRKQDALGLGSGSAPLLAETIGERLFLLRGLQFGEQKGVAHADFLGIERIHHRRGKFRQSNSGGAIRRRFPNFRRDLLNAVLRVFQVEQGLETLRLLQRVNVAALQVFN